MACSSICRWIVIAFVIVVALYVAAATKLLKFSTNEQFSSELVPMTESNKLLAIYDVYRKLLGRPPHDHELSECMKSIMSNDDVDAIREAILATDEYKRNEERRKELAVVFEKYVGRTPNDDELEKVVKNIKATDTDDVKVKTVVTVGNTDGSIEGPDVSPQTGDAGGSATESFASLSEPVPHEQDKDIDEGYSTDTSDKEDATTSPEQTITEGLETKSDEKKDRPQLQSAEVEELRKKFNTYDCIVRTFQTILDRMPTSVELDKYYIRMTRDPKITKDKLRDILQASAEYKRMYMNQKNDVFTDLPANTTDAQATSVVRDVYMKVMGSNPSEAVEAFLKDKYVGFELDEHKLKRYIGALADLDRKNESREDFEAVQANDDPKADRYSKYLERRNLNELKYACNRNAFYAREDVAKALNGADIGHVASTLCPRQAVQHPCISDGGAFNVRPMIDQSALIGTLLDDIESTPLGFQPPKA